MSRVSVDDRSPLIKYVGWWEENSVAHSAWDYGTQAIFTFKGTSVFVYGNIPDGDGETVRVDFSIDGGRAVSKYRTSGNRMIPNVVWWESGALSDGQHTVTMTYLSEDDMDFRLDRIEYVPSAPQQTAAPTTSGVNIAPVVSTSTSTRVAFVTQTSTSSHVEVVTGTSSTTTGPANLALGEQTSSPSSSTLSSPSSSPSSLPITTVFVASDGQTVTQTQYLPAASVTDASSGGATVGDGSAGTTAQASSGASKTVPVGAIVGGVIGSLAFLSLYLILFIVVRRKRIRRKEIVEYGFAEGKGVSSTSEQMPQPPIGPFVDPAATNASQNTAAPVGLTSKATLLARERSQVSRNGQPTSSDLTSDIYTDGYTAHTVLTEAAPAYASGGLSPDGRFRENFASEAGTIRTWSSGVAEASDDSGSQEHFGQPPAYR